MKTTGVIIIVGALLGLFALTVQAVGPEEKIEITIQGGVARDVSGYTFTGVPTEIKVYNQDTDVHAFISSLFGKNDKVELVAGGYRAEGRGPNVFRVDPGKTMVLRFTKASQEGVGSTSYPFWCDLHRTVKGEILVVEGK
jgi:hypothetical protein